MPYTPPSETSVANLAVDILDDFPVASLAEPGKVASFLNRNFWQVHGEVSLAFPWNHAKARASLPKDGVAPAYGWANSYTMPADALAVFPLRRDGEWNGDLLPFEVEGRSIVTDVEAPLPIRYLKRVENPGLWSPQFIRVFACTLALYGAQNITGKAGYVEKAGSMLKMAWEAATLAETLYSGRPEPQFRNEIIDVRGVGLSPTDPFRTMVAVS